MAIIGPSPGAPNRAPAPRWNIPAAALLEATRFIPEKLLIVYLPVVLVSVYVSIALGIKRCHDRDKSGFFLLLNLIPLLNLWPAIELTFFKGTPGPNEYGPDPLE